MKTTTKTPTLREQLRIEYVKAMESKDPILMNLAQITNLLHTKTLSR